MRPILDGLAPHVWHGQQRLKIGTKMQRLLASGKVLQTIFLTLGRPLHADVTGDSAYVVTPATMSFKRHGKQITQFGAIFTTALRKLADGWRITAWAWAKGTPQAT